MKDKFYHTPRKRFGQNFLQDAYVIQKILDSIDPQPLDKMVEIGPGLGALTQPLLNAVDHLDVIELDRELANQLQTTLGQSNKLTIYQADALQFDFNTLFSEKKLRIVGNLPYNISTPLMFHLFQYCPLVQDMHFMLQKEVVERLIAEPNTKQYGRLSIMTQYYCQIKYLFTVEADSFYPKPKVKSAVVQLIPYKQLPFPAYHFETLQTITRAAFNLRRKTLSNALKSYLTPHEFQVLDINPTLRPEALSLSDFVHISNFVFERDSGTNLSPATDDL